MFKEILLHMADVGHVGVKMRGFVGVIQICLITVKAAV